MSSNTHAVGQMQGYMLQVRHMLFELISLDDIIVSVEKLDDVAVETPDGSVIAEQLKSVTSDGNPATDRSAVFWKTLYNWFNYVNNGSLIVDKTIFRMVVVSNHKLGVGDIADKFHKASKKEDALKALEAAKLNIWGKDDILKSEVPDSYGSYLEVLFSPANKDLVAQIISRVELDIHENDYDEKLIKKFSGQSIPPEFADNLLVFMLGWVTEEVNNYIKQGLPAVITSIDYRKALVAQCRMYNQQNAIPALSREITPDEARTEVESQDVYIRQLDLIQMDFDDKLDAASDYLQTKAETTIRAEKGLFAPQSSKDYNDKICRIWKSKRKQVLLLPACTDVMKGQQLYAQMGEVAPQIDSALPSFFGSGTLQTLANNPCEDPEIGWHPNYKELLKGDLQNG
ncbi:ABC-three component system protein [Candidatus Formimonas warabiya]|uniref:ABC-three component systems C-terminal domain-containing protein n=1 Tax=Formimonas warabiya TaxID=1761012 RepID=A0A3G1KSM5_FORW1|nr:ABC-three component system protein [Candidatus Formimonas warabiya]ATW25430.1 hypothetical protein DCMF_12175 [Candidatus Formimonas warabiya]